MRAMNVSEMPSVQVASPEQLLENAEQLIWELLDGDLNEKGMVELQAMFRMHPKVLDLYISCAQLHSDAIDQFRTVKRY